MQLLYKYDTIRFRGQPNKTAENERYAMKRIWEEGLRDDKRVARVGHYATINSRGEIMIGRFTYEALGRADALQLLFDRVNMSIGLKRTHSRTDNAYSLKPADMSFLSFPSGHSASACSIAAVISYEYKDRPKVRYGVLAAAMAVSIARFTGRTHFISEVLIGSAIGFYTGRYVYHTYHVPTKDPNSAPALPPKETTKLMPMIIPLYDARTSTYGGRAVWSF